MFRVFDPMFRVPGTSESLAGQGLFRVFRVFRVYARVNAYLTHAPFFLSRLHAVHIPIARVHPEHPEHKEQTSNGKASACSGYPEHGIPYPEHRPVSRRIHRKSDLMTGNDSEFAAWLGVNKSTVSRARKAGRLVLAADGRVDFEASAAKWHATAGGRTDVAARHAANRGAAVPQGHPSEKNATARENAAPPAIEDDDTDRSSRIAAKAALVHFENQALKLDMAMKRGLRFHRSAVKREALGLGGMLRAAIERVIDQTAPRLAATADDAERRRVLDAELRRLRWVIKREMPRALRRMREDGKAGGEA